MKTIALALGLAALSAAPLVAQVDTPQVASMPDSVDAALLPNYVVVQPGLASAGRPTEEGLRQLKAQGFRTVIDLRTPAEPGLAEEKALVEAQGLRYVNVPLMPASFSAADVDAVKSVLDDPTSGPVLLHCAVGNRVGGVWAVLQARSGKSLDEAIAEGKRAGLRSDSMVAAAQRVASGASPAEGPKVPKP